MPEGPEVCNIAKSLNFYLQGKKLISGTLLPTSRYYKHDKFEGMEYLTHGLTLVKVFSRGKKIIFEFEKNTFMICSLGMEGHWLQIPTKHTALYLDFGRVEGKFRIIEKTMYYEDSRHFGTLNVYTCFDKIKIAMKTVGPDLLQDNISIQQYTQIIKSKTLSKKELHWFLLEQKYLSGIGNYLKSEILYASKLAPNRTIQSLSDEDIFCLYSNSIQIIRKAYECNGLTLGTYVDPDGNIGTYDPMVYQKEIDPLGNKVVKTQFGGKDRTTHWVPEIQI